MRIAGVILAGGRSSRMGGQDKALVTVCGKPLIARAVERLRPQVDALAVSANAEPARFAAFGCAVIGDAVPDHAGPLAGILAGLDWAEGAFDAVVTAAVDTPFFPLDLARSLADPQKRCAVAASNERLHPVFAFWPVAMRAGLRAFLQRGETRRVMSFLDEQGFRTVEFPLLATATMEMDPFFNINTPADLAAAAALALEIDA